MAKVIFISKISRYCPGRIFKLSVRDRHQNEDDWRKLRRVLEYLQEPLKGNPVVRIERGKNIAKWNIDAFAVHNSLHSQKIHTVGILCNLLLFHLFLFRLACEIHLLHVIHLQGFIHLFSCILFFSNLYGTHSTFFQYVLKVFIVFTIDSIFCLILLLYLPCAPSYHFVLTTLLL